MARPADQPAGPLLAILDAAGLKSVQTLGDIARFVLEQEGDRWSP